MKLQNDKITSEYVAKLGVGTPAELGLRTNLGLPPVLVASLLHRDSSFQMVMRVVSKALAPFEAPLLRLLRLVPDRVGHMIMMKALAVWVGLHRVLPAWLVRRGISDSLSIESHALSTVMWFARLLPMTVGRIRLGMDALRFLHPHERSVKEEYINLPDRGVKGLYLHAASPMKQDPPVLFWVFGGAHIGGDVYSNRGLCERYAQQLGCDVFIPDLRLFPEHTMFDSYRDCCRAYEWLLNQKSPEKIICLGISSGAAVLLRTLTLAKADQEERQDFFCSDSTLPQPAGCVFIGGFFDYYTDEENSIVRLKEVDWLVTQRLYEWVHPMIGDMAGGQDRRRAVSPFFDDFRGLCPVCVSISEHDVTIDENKELVLNLQKGGVDVDFQTQPYLCHAFALFSPMLPEARLAEAKVLSWIGKQGPAWEA